MSGGLEQTLPSCLGSNGVGDGRQGRDICSESHDSINITLSRFIWRCFLSGLSQGCQTATQDRPLPWPGFSAVGGTLGGRPGLLSRLRHPMGDDGSPRSESRCAQRGEAGPGWTQRGAAQRSAGAFAGSPTLPIVEAGDGVPVDPPGHLDAEQAHHQPEQQQLEEGGPQVLGLPVRQELLPEPGESPQHARGGLPLRGSGPGSCLSLSRHQTHPPLAQWRDPQGFNAAPQIQTKLSVGPRCACARDNLQTPPSAGRKSRLVFLYTRAGFFQVRSGEWSQTFAQDAAQNSETGITSG